MVERLVALVNRVWEERDSLEPDTTTHKRLQPLELYQLLPRTNCRVCGEETCFNFALKLVANQTQLERCIPLHEPGFEEQRERLETLLATRWPAF